MEIDTSKSGSDGGGIGTRDDYIESVKIYLEKLLVYLNLSNLNRYNFKNECNNGNTCSNLLDETIENYLKLNQIYSLEVCLKIHIYSYLN